MDSFEEANRRARELLYRVLPLEERTRLRCEGFVGLVAASGRRYKIAPHSQTEVFSRSGRPESFACLQLTVPAPAYDRMIAEYLLIRNDEAVYRKTANLFQRTPRFGLIELLLAMVCVGLACSVVAHLNLLR